MDNEEYEPPLGPDPDLAPIDWLATTAAISGGAALGLVLFVWWATRKPRRR